MANYALLEWPENIDISDAPPSEYMPAIRPRLSDPNWAMMQDLHALPDNWERMEYQEFLQARRVRMADIIRRGFESLR